MRVELTVVERQQGWSLVLLAAECAVRAVVQDRGWNRRADRSALV